MHCFYSKLLRKYIYLNTRHTCMLEHTEVQGSEFGVAEPSKFGVAELVLPLLRSKRAHEPSGAQIKRFEASEQLSAHELL